MKLLYDTHLLLGRHIQKTVRTPHWILIGLMQPILYLVLYMPLLKKMQLGSGIPESQIIQLFVPGVLFMMAVSTLFAGFSFISDMREGLIARWLVTPVSRFALIVSLLLNQLIELTLQWAILLTIAYFMGLRVGILPLLLGYVIIMLVGAAFAALSYTIALVVGAEDGLAAITSTFFLPIMLLSGVYLPMSLAPDWMAFLAHLNPFYHAVESLRSLFTTPQTWLVIKGFGLMLAFGMFTLTLATRALRKMAA
jgi:ABC-2 type transport system permease protein